MFGTTDPEQIRRQHQLDALILTRGPAGAAIYFPTGAVAGAPPPLSDPLQDTVGAGDAFAAAVIHGMQQGQPAESILREALALSAKVCGIRGADWL